jgi:hypothetical protein
VLVRASRIFGVTRRAHARHVDTAPPVEQQGLSYKHFQIRHPSYDAGYWRKCRALYAGGKKLLRDPVVMEEVFHHHHVEEAFVYAERKKRAFHVAYAGSIVDKMKSALLAKPLTVTAEPEADPFYAEFREDCSKQGGNKRSLNELAAEVILTAMQTQHTWVLVDLPPAEASEEPSSLKDQEKAGKLRAYAEPLDAECVLDWECDEAGALTWALVCTTTRKRAGLLAMRNTVREEYTFYTRETWDRYVFEYVEGKPPNGDESPRETTSGAHTFRAVPLLQFTLPDGLYPMGKLESIAVAHFNLVNAVHWASLKSAFPILVGFMSEGTPGKPKTAKEQDGNRAVNQKVGPGRIMVLAEKDRLEYVSPDTSAFTFLGEHEAKLRDESYRVVHQMADSIDNSGAALQRSAESKSVDQGSAAVVLREFGRLLREFMERVHQLVEAGRGDKPVTWAVTGMDSFDDVSTGDLIDEATKVELISIPSATFQQLHKLSLAANILKDLTEEQLAAIDRELKANISNEMFAAPALNAPTDKAPVKDDDEPEDDADDDEIPPDPNDGADR